MNKDLKLQIVKSVPVSSFLDICKDKLQLHLVAGDKGLNRLIREKSINRPALTITGYFRHFASKRLQLFGAGEMDYMRHLSKNRQLYIMRELAKNKIPCIIVSRGLLPTKVMLQIAQEFEVPLFRSHLKTKDLSAEATIWLEYLFAPKMSLYGTLLDVRGIGTLIRGKSGVGKSECALALVERGHSLVADDLCHVRLVNDSELVGTSAELNRGYMECRGLGIINVAELFGIRSVRLKKRIDLIITFLEWGTNVEEDRTGLEQKYFSALNAQIPHMEIPVRPGRDMSRLVEVAAMVQAQKQMGHHPAKEFNQRLIEHMTQSA